ncbi:MAG: EAL domain-containing protein [Candidatus Dormibacteria bacterium]
MAGQTERPGLQPPWELAIERALCPDLVGRQEEVAELVSALLSADRGDGGLVVLMGDAGMGKSRVLEEVRRHAAQRGWTVLTGSCSEAELALPYLPYVEALSDYLVGADDRLLRARLGAAREELGQLFPRLAGSAERDAYDPTRRKLALFEAVLALLQMIAEGGGLLLCIEDLNWADASSRDLLDYLARRVRGTRLLIVATARGDELGRRHPLVALLGAWRRAGVAEVMELKALRPDEVGRMIQLTLGSDSIHPGFAASLHRHCEGNPYVVEETLKELLDAGRLPRGADGWEELTGTGGLGIPRSVAENVLRRVGRLGEAEVQVLQCAAVLGRSFAYSTLVRLSSLDESSLQAALQLCLEEQLLEEDPSSTTRYQFRHALTREAIYGDVLRPRREFLHARAAEILSSHPVAAAMDVAHHLLAAGNWEQAVPVCLAAAEDALRRRGYAEAAELFRRVLPHLVDLATRGRTRAAMGEATWLAGDPGTAAGILAEAVQELEDHGLQFEAAHYRLALGRCYWVRSSPVLATQEYEAAERVLATGPATEDLAITYLRLAGMHAFQFEGGPAQALAQRAGEVAEAADAPDTCASALTTTGIAMVYQGHVEEGLQKIDESRRVASRAGFDNVAGNAVYSAIMLRLWNQRAHECPPLLALLSGNGGWLQETLLGRARAATHLVRGELSLALSAVEDLVTTTRHSGALNFQEWNDRLRTIIHAELGQADEASRALPPRRTRLERQDRFFDYWARMRLAQATQSARPRSGTASVARGILHDCVWTAGLPLLLGIAAEGFHAAGDATSLEAIVARARVAGVPSANPQALYAAGLLADLRKDPGAAAVLAKARAGFAATECRLDELRVRLALARTLAREATPEAARDELGAVLDQARALGARLLEGQARRAATEMGLVSSSGERRSVSRPVPQNRASELPPPSGRLTIFNELRNAISGGGLALVYQPKLDLRTGTMQSVEALVRWEHPRLGTLAPDRFIPLAEQSGLIKPLTSWVLAAAIDQAKRWRARGVSLDVSINLSTADLEDARLAEIVEEHLETARVPANTIGVELVETGVMADPARAISTLRDLKTLGVQVSIDDFGIGQSSLAYLRQLPADEIKIDRSFCIEMDERNMVIVRSAIGMGHDLGLRVVAEGVETQDTMDRLVALGCDVAQGYLVGRPTTAIEIARRARREASLRSAQAPSAS